MKKILTVVLITLLLIIACSYVTVFDSEWRNGKVLDHVRNTYQKLYEYKQANGKYPDHLQQIDVSEKYCLLTFCHLLVYSPSNGSQDIVIVAEVNDPFIVYLSSQCPNNKAITEENAGNCASFAFKEDYQGDRIDFPIYRKDQLFTATPSAWPDIR